MRNEHKEIDFEEEADRICKKLSIKYEPLFRRSQMKYDRSFSNFDKYCKDLVNEEIEKIEFKISNRLEVLQIKLSKFDIKSE